MFAVEFVRYAATLADANAIANSFTGVGYLGSRVVPKIAGSPYAGSFTVYGYWQFAGQPKNFQWPADCKAVSIPDGLAPTLFGG